MADQTSELAKAIQDVTRHAQVIVRDEIELAKLEVQTKVQKLAKGAAVGAAAGVFVLAGLIYFLHFAAWGIADLLGDHAVQAADYVLFALPSMLGVDYNAHLFENLVAIARDLGWKE